MKKSEHFYNLPLFSWQKPIEQELLSWARYMKRQNLIYISTTIWGKRQKREAQIYANAFEMIEKRILREIAVRNDDTNNPK